MTTMVDSKENVSVDQDKVSEKFNRKNKQVQTQKYMVAVKMEKFKKIRDQGVQACVVYVCTCACTEQGRKGDPGCKGSCTLKMLKDIHTCSDWVKRQGID